MMKFHRQWLSVELRALGFQGEGYMSTHVQNVQQRMAQVVYLDCGLYAHDRGPVFV